MKNDQLIVNEIFYSLQGESSLAGVPFAFIRLTGCHLRCKYCDTTYAYQEGYPISIPEIIMKIKEFRTKYVLITGGEPLLQKNTPDLLRALKTAGFQLCIETSGEISIESVTPYARIIMDIKTPGSGISSGSFTKNLKYLKSDDEVKFVITSETDYQWAKELIFTGRIPTQEILFSPAFQRINPQWLGNQILKDHLPVRLQLQLHKLLWPEQSRGI